MSVRKSAVDYTKNSEAVSNATGSNEGFSMKKGFFLRRADSRSHFGPSARQSARRSGKLLARSRRSGLRFSPKTTGRLQPAVPRRNHGLRARPLRRQQTLAPHSRHFPPLRAHDTSHSGFVTQSRRGRRVLRSGGASLLWHGGADSRARGAQGSPVASVFSLADTHSAEGNVLSRSID